MRRAEFLLFRLLRSVLRHATPVDLVSAGDGNSVQIQNKGLKFPTPGHDRGWDTAGLDGHGHFCRSICRATFVGHWTSQGREKFFRSSLEARPRRTYRHVPRSESTGGARGSAQEIALDQDPEKAGIADSGKLCQHTPDEGATFTLLLVLFTIVFGSLVVSFFNFYSFNFFATLRPYPLVQTSHLH